MDSASAWHGVRIYQSMWLLASCDHGIDETPEKPMIQDAIMHQEMCASALREALGNDVGQIVFGHMFS